MDVSRACPVKPTIGIAFLEVSFSKSRMAEDSSFPDIPGSPMSVKILGPANRIGSAHDILRMNPSYFANGFW
jgi:hypothetical protein